MNDLLRVQVQQRFGDVSGHQRRRGLVETSMFGDVIEQIAALDQFHDQVDLCGCFVVLEQPNDIRMVAHVHDVDLMIEHVFFALREGKFRRS